MLLTATVNGLNPAINHALPILSALLIGIVITIILLYLRHKAPRHAPKSSGKRQAAAPRPQPEGPPGRHRFPPPMEEPSSSQADATQAGAGKGLASQYLGSSYYERTGNDLLEIIRSRGMHGELKTTMKLIRHFQSDYVFPNVYLPVEGHSTEIDILMLTRKEIYIIENKDWGGSIYGTQKSNQWKQYWANAQKKYANPVKQNWGHYYAFCNLFHAIPKNRVVPIVVFNDLSNLHIRVDSMAVLKRGQLIEHIEQRQAAATDYFSQRDLRYLAQMLAPYIKLDEDKKQEHVEYVQSQKKS